MIKPTAFSLVELSIVLVILGLLVGGVLSGQSLIHAAELRSLTTDRDKYSAATNSFRDKYFALPGDMINATQFWGSLGGTGSDATCQNIAATGAPTCNGNGDGQVLQSVVAFDEVTRFWQHLANAGLIEGRYTGLMNGTPTPGTNMPLTKLGPNVEFTTSTRGTVVGTTQLFSGEIGNQFLLRTPSSTNASNTQVLVPADLWNVDTKMDDGLPATGNLVANKANAPNACTNMSGIAPPGDAGAVYNVSITTKDCAFYFAHVY